MVHNFMKKFISYLTYFGPILLGFTILPLFYIPGIIFSWCKCKLENHKKEEDSSSEYYEQEIVGAEYKFCRHCGKIIKL